MTQTQLKPFLAKAGSNYTLSRAQEELESAENEKDHIRRDELLRNAIQLINITRYKLNEEYNTRQQRVQEDTKHGPKA